MGGGKETWTEWSADGTLVLLRVVYLYYREFSLALPSPPGLMGERIEERGPLSAGTISRRSIADR
jgi:hypothetical protein